MLGFAVVVALFIANARPTAPGNRRDPRRLFPADVRQEGFRRAGNRCEMESLPGIRCRRQASAGDHWFPHSLGGATTTTNLVAACTRCNSRKRARIPSYGQTLRLEARRRRYFPPGAPTTAGAWAH